MVIRAHLDLVEDAIERQRKEDVTYSLFTFLTANKHWVQRHQKLHEMIRQKLHELVNEEGWDEGRQFVGQL